MTVSLWSFSACTTKAAKQFEHTNFKSILEDSCWVVNIIVIYHMYMVGDSKGGLRGEAQGANSSSLDLEEHIFMFA